MQPGVFSRVPSPAAVDSLVERLTADMAERWRRGERPLTEEYLARHPELADRPEAAIELIYEELCLREEHGPRLTAAELVGRFPRWQAQLRVLLDCHQLLESQPIPPRFPGAGESLAGFHLVTELGRGARGRVFLATQPALADRPMVLKLTPADGREHLSLARLQHSHIVPLYAVHDEPARNLRALCMPYFGGATLAQLLDSLQDLPPVRRTGRDLLRALERAQAAAPVAVPVEGPACQYLAGASYVEAICWLGACLADGLQYAQEHRLVHLDLKPSNVLLAADGQPMLLDFHLAREPIESGTPPPEWLGGTPGYMAPEQRTALAAVGAGRRMPAAVDGRADLYSLGVLLYEALAGAMPAAEPAPPLVGRNPRVGPGLSDLVAKCLAAEPGQRYASAAALAADLRRHLTDRPLHHVANRSLVERWGKWRRRRPYGLVVAGGALAAAGIVAAALLHLNTQQIKARLALDEGRTYQQRAQYAEAAGALERGLAWTEYLPFSGDLDGALRGHLRQVRRAQAVQEFHHFADHIRFLYSAEALPAASLRRLEEHCRTFWKFRDRISEYLEPGLPSNLERGVHNDLLDLAVIGTDLHVRRTPAEGAEAARREALQTLEEAEQLFGPSRVLCLERQRHAAALGLTDVARTAAQRAAGLVPATAWEHYALGRFLLRTGEVARAAEELEQAVRLQPADLWPNFYVGTCACQRGQFEEALVAFTACILLAPRSGWCYHNRALAYTGLGRLDRALQDYNHALELEPLLGPAALNRGVLHYRLEHYQQAVDDLEQARGNGADPAAVYYNMALVRLAQGNRSAALASVRQALRHAPGHKDARALRDSLQATP